MPSKSYLLFLFYGLMGYRDVVSLLRVPFLLYISPSHLFAHIRIQFYGLEYRCRLYGRPIFVVISDFTDLHLPLSSYVPTTQPLCL
ncbi:hypothetical protein F4813DRAFT_355486, partial [Daldinia decipiens]|uniref:uncharacterized protein n=1 Tax=Daldinia decipiens TaxID=326647 RepID=UPI0020C4FAB1